MIFFLFSENFILKKSQGLLRNNDKDIKPGKITIKKYINVSNSEKI